MDERVRKPLAASVGAVLTSLVVSLFCPRGGLHRDG